MQSLGHMSSVWLIEPPFNTIEIVCHAAQIQEPPPIHQPDLIPSYLADPESPCHPSNFVAGRKVRCIVLDLNQRATALDWFKKWEMDWGPDFYFVHFDGNVTVLDRGVPREKLSPQEAELVLQRMRDEVSEAIKDRERQK